MITWTFLSWKTTKNWNSIWIYKKYMYSGGHLRWDGKSISFCLTRIHDIICMRTNKLPLKSPIKMLQELQNFFFQKLLIFRASFEKPVFKENGCGRHQIGAMLIHYTFIFSEYQWESLPERFIQKYWLIQIWNNYFF